MRNKNSASKHRIAYVIVNRMDMENLKIITSTTRPGRKGIAVAEWIYNLALEDSRFNSELLDLAKINLPFMDEPNHPRLQQYQHEHTRRWSATISGADAFIIVLAEYNFSIPAPIKNALDFLFNEWKHKPVAIVSYGGVSGGLRSTQMLKQVLTALNMMPLVESVAVPFFAKYIGEDNVFAPEEIVTQSAHVMLNELHRWSETLKPLRK
jgi:NAD(P)H-dependent FMN reductase